MRVIREWALRDAIPVRKIARRTAKQMHADQVQLGFDGGYLPVSALGGASWFHLLSKPYACSSVIITTNQFFSEWVSVFDDAKMTTALLDRLNHRNHILETGNDSYQFKARSETAKKQRK